MLFYEQSRVKPTCVEVTGIEFLEHINLNLDLPYKHGL